MVTITLVRGLPGSGKSYSAKLLCQETNSIHLETDQFFTDDNGFYTFNPAQLKIAHGWCIYTTKEHVKKGHNVVVSNTFSQQWEMEPYRKIAAQFNAKIMITQSSSPWAWNVKECAKRNSHGVPIKAIQAMYDRWED